MPKAYLIALSLFSLCLSGCENKPLAPKKQLSEKSPGGIYTSINTLSNAFDMPAAYLNQAQKKQYHLGRRLFQHPQFNCQQCHYLNGRSDASKQGLFDQQLNPPKHWPWRYKTFNYPDGKQTRLRKPSQAHAYQIAPKLVGMGLLAQLSDNHKESAKHDIKRLDFHPQWQQVLSPENLNALRLYSFHSAVPAPRAFNTTAFDTGRERFYQFNCHRCHQAKQQVQFNWIDTNPVDIWPYSDFKVHDMGEELANKNQRRWQTPTLWGLGFSNKVNSQAGFLHDGRARTYEAAILWHGGEAAASRQAFIEAKASERKQLLDFLHLL